MGLKLAWEGQLSPTSCMLTTSCFFQRQLDMTQPVSSEALKNIAIGLDGVSIGTSQGSFSLNTISLISEEQSCTLLAWEASKRMLSTLKLPFFLSKAPSNDFIFLVEKMESKLIRRRSKCLSWAGRATLISSVAQVLPNYICIPSTSPPKFARSLTPLL